MKNCIPVFLLTIFSLIANAQIKVHTGGKVSVGSTTTITYNLGVTGDADLVASGNAYRIQGNKVLWYNSTATTNIFVGVGAGNAIPSGTNNSFFGYQAGYANSSGGSNTYLGYKAGTANTSGLYNTCIGQEAGSTATTVAYNSFLGYQAGKATTGQQNTFSGAGSGLLNTSGYYNTFYGAWAGQTETSGYSNTCIGYGADVSTGGWSNSTAIGASASVNAHNKTRIGNTYSGNVYETQNAWTTTSDGRFKENIQENVVGLDFILKLRPVTYKFNSQKFDDFLFKDVPDSIKAIRTQYTDYVKSLAFVHTGFIAQEVEQAANAVGIVFDGIHAPADSSDNYSLAYPLFVVPLVKSVQELSALLEAMRLENAALQARILALENK